MSQNHYRVFVSHGSDDHWIAAQIARCVRDLGADTFLDKTNIPKGANFKQIIHHREIAASNEVLALFYTVVSKAVLGVGDEIGAAWGQDKPVVAVFYGMEVRDLEESGQGKGMLEDINVIQLNELERYLVELGAR